MYNNYIQIWSLHATQILIDPGTQRKIKIIFLIEELLKDLLSVRWKSLRHLTVITYDVHVPWALATVPAAGGNSKMR